MPEPTEPPPKIELSLEEAEELYAALEDAAGFLARLMAHEPLQVLDLIGPLGAINYQLSVIGSKLGHSEGGANAG